MSAARRCSPSPASPARTSLLFLDVEQARERLKTNPWIADATVLKLYPGELQIAIKERLAFALWQKDGRVSVIADDGTVLEPFVAPQPDPAAAGGRPRRRDAGEGLPGAARSLSADRATSVRASILVGERRWNLRLKNGIDVRLPETDVAAALERLVALDREKKLITRDIVAIDLRLPDRVTVRLSDAAAQARADALKDKKPKKKGGARMSALQFGLTPKMKPLPPKRSALVGRARCRHQQDRLPDRAAQAAARRRTCCAAAQPLRSRWSASVIRSRAA